MKASLPLSRPNDFRPIALSLDDAVCSLRSYAPMRDFAFSLVGERVLVSSHGSIGSPEETGFDGWNTRYADYVLQHPVKFWEYCRVLDMLQPRAGERILDVGGASSPLSFYLASLGCEIEIADYEAVSRDGRSIVGNANRVASDRHWKLHAVHADATRLPYEDATFDAVTSVSVLEHVGSLRRQRRASLRHSASCVIGNEDWDDINYADPEIVEWEKAHSRFVLTQLRRTRWYTAFSLFLRRPPAGGRV